MEYNWSIEQIKEQKKQVKDLLRHAKGLAKEEKEILKQEIINLEEIENNENMNKLYYPCIKKIKYVDSNKFLPVYTLQEYTLLSSNLKKYILNSIPCFRNFEDCYEDIKLPSINLTDQELVNMSYDFYKWIPDKSCLEYFFTYTNPNNHLLRFTSIPSLELFGLTQPFYYPAYQPYFLVVRCNTIEDLYTLNHEIAHGIYFQKDSHKTLNSQHYYLTELEGDFFEYLTGKYLKEKVDNSIIQELDHYRFIIKYNDICELYLMDYTIHLINKENKIDIISIMQKILEDKLTINTDKGGLHAALCKNPQENAKSIISYFTSLDLETIFEKDPEYAFYLFNRIRNNKTDNIWNNLRENGITFMDDGYQNLQKKIKTFGGIKL